MVEDHTETRGSRPIDSGLRGDLRVVRRIASSDGAGGFAADCGRLLDAAAIKAPQCEKVIIETHP